MIFVAASERLANFHMKYNQVTFASSQSLSLSVSEISLYDIMLAMSPLTAV